MRPSMRKFANLLAVFAIGASGRTKTVQWHPQKTRSTPEEINVSHVVTVSFDRDREYEIMPHDGDIQGMDKDQARAWLAREFEELECVPSNPVGKILLLDMILNVAKYAGEECFENGGEWARSYAIAVAVTLQRPAIRVDVANFVVG